MSLELKIALILIISFAICLIRSFRLKKLVNSRDFLDTAINVGTIILAVSLLIRVFSEQQVKELLKDDAISLFIGAGAQIFLSLENKEIRQDFVYLFGMIFQRQDYFSYFNAISKRSAS